MKRLLIIFVVFVLGFGSWTAFASQDKEASAAALAHPPNSADGSADDLMAEAKQDYKVYLEQLRLASQQYKEVTGEMKKVIEEEGVPVFDEETGEITIQHDLDFQDAVPVEETDTEMSVSLELPGLKRESLQVKIKDKKTLFITAERRNPKENEPAEIIERAVSLPVPASEKGTRASYQDGILQITLLKETPSESSIPVD